MAGIKHDSLSLVLDDVTGAADLVAAAETEEHELVGGVDGLLGYGRGHGGGLALGRHDDDDAVGLKERMSKGSRDDQGRSEARSAPGRQGEEELGLL